VICWYLLFWSVGVYISRHIKIDLAKAFLTTALSVLLVTIFFRYVRDTKGWVDTAIFSSMVYTLPCIGFGIAFGQLVTRVSVNWGNDIGRFYGLNTIGSCLGILMITLVGYEFPHPFVAMATACGYLVLLRYYQKRSSHQLEPSRPWRLMPYGIALFCLVLIGQGSVEWRRLYHTKNYKTYFGRDGVIELYNRAMYWNGMWHSELSLNNNHVGTRNWKMAVVPLLAHNKHKIKEVLVVGLGTGISVGTLAGSGNVENIDVYEINHELKHLLRDYPDGSLHVLDNKKVNVMWRDGRSGLALNEKKYDLITQQPLYLKQAGSAILLS